MKKLVASLLALVLVLSLVACGSGDNTDHRVNIPKPLTDVKGKDYKNVMTLLQVAGFTNIEVEVLDDLITGWLTKDGEVEKVSINGDTDFSASSKYPKDAKIVITYHTFPMTEPEEVTETTETPKATEVIGVSGSRTVSEFDTKTNQTISWCGINFSYPSYFNVKEKSSTETLVTFYPEEKDYYASIMFQSQEFSGTQEYFISQIPSIVKSTMDTDYFANAKLQKSEEISIAELPGWTITFSKSDTNGDGVISYGRYSFAYNINTGKIVMITCTYDSNDQSKYDYLSDYKKVLETAKLLAEPLDLNTINSTKSAESDAQFVGKYYRVTGIIDQAMEPSEGLNAMVIIEPDVMAKGMGSTLPLEINIWLTADEFEKIGGLSSVGKQIDLSVILTSISRNANSKDPTIKGYPIQLEFGEHD